MPKKPAPLTDDELAKLSTPYRRMVREVLAASRRKLSADGIIAMMQVRDPGLSRDLAEAALQWNFKRGNVNFDHNNELEVDEWELTTRGKQAL